ncbi:MAG: hypothetical protein COB02_00255 [Candidatus Cloacimonadota bacterium]|nr:MAG: hypothetical protein COB02_00255 [Candidatus Cloacimonadota bacterium]
MLSFRFICFCFCLFLHISVCICSNNLEITLISPEIGTHLNQDSILLEGLVSDLSIEEIKVLINSQKIQFVKVTKGYFKQEVLFDKRVNHLVLYGANFKRDYFKKEFIFINHSRREKTKDEKIPPELFLNYLEPDVFKTLSPSEYASIKVNLRDNETKKLQFGYIFNDDKPKYFHRLQGEFLLKLPNPKGKKSIYLNIFSIDDDGNRSSKNYHFRVEHLKCSATISPPLGLFGITSVIANIDVEGGMGNIKKRLYLLARDGERHDVTILDNKHEFKLDSQHYKKIYKLSVEVEDENGIISKCISKKRVIRYSKNSPRNFRIGKRTKLQTIKQKFHFKIEPPIKWGEVIVLLKKKDQVSGYLGQAWRTLGNLKLNSKSYKRSFLKTMRKSVSSGKYLMKLSLVLGADTVNFSESTEVEVTRSEDDTVDLLQEILRDEN